MAINWMSRQNELHFCLSKWIRVKSNKISFLSGIAFSRSARALLCHSGGIFVKAMHSNRFGNICMSLTHARLHMKPMCAQIVSYSLHCLLFVLTFIRFKGFKLRKFMLVKWFRARDSINNVVGSWTIRRKQFGCHKKMIIYDFDIECITYGLNMYRLTDLKRFLSTIQLNAWDFL